jgi:hypothetical protein
LATADCRNGLLAAIAFAAIACVYTWPLIVFPTSAIAHDRGDPLLVTWILWWTSHTIPLTEAWWNAPAFYPSAGVLAFSENLLSLAPITAPIVRATGSPILAYNVAFLLSYVLSGLGAYLLAFVLTRCHGASFVAGVAFAFAPYRLSHTHHLQLLSSYWMPVAIAALHLYLKDPRWRWAVLFAVAWLLQALASGYYLFFLSTFAVVWLAWFVPGRLPLRQMLRLATAWVAAGLILLPLLLGYRSIHGLYGFRRSPVEVVNYSADVAGIVSASPFSWIWGNLHANVGSESEQFPGVTLLLLLLVGLTGQRCLAPQVPGTFGARHRERAPLVFFVAAAGLMWMLSLGPAPKMAGTAIGVPGPYAILALLPGFDGMRVPARLWMVAIMCLATAAALVVARIQNRRARSIAIAVSVVGMLLDAWPRAFPVVAAPDMRVTASQARARLGLPLHETETETMYGAIAQRRPVFNGYSGYAAPQHAALRDLLEQRDRRILDRLAGAASIEVIVESAGDADGQWNAFVAGHPRAARIGGGPDWTAYEISPTGALAPAAIGGRTLAIERIDTTANVPHINAVLDNDLETRWHVVPQSGGETITVTLDEAQHVAALVLCLGTYAGQYPRLLALEVSADSVAWSTVYTGGTALETYDAALRSPREVPITLPVQRDGVKFLRLRQLGRDLRRGWTIVELRVIG